MKPETDAEIEFRLKQVRQGTARALRAQRFANTVMAMMRDYIIPNRDTWRMIEDHLHRIGFEINAEIISVPPECDHMDKLALEKHMLETKAAILPRTSRSGDDG
jgi:hypothetical protein